MKLFLKTLWFVFLASLGYVIQRLLGQDVTTAWVMALSIALFITLTRRFDEIETKLRKRRKKVNSS